MSIKNIGFAILLVGLNLFMSVSGSTAEAAEVSESAIVSDPALTSFVRAVIETNPRVRAARAALDASLAFEDAAERPLYNPAIEFDAENADSKTRSLGLSQTLDWGGKRKARTTVAEYERRSIEADFVSVRWQVTVDLLSGLAGFQTETDRFLLTIERTRLLKDFATLAEQRFDAGDLNQIEYDLAALTYAEARMLKATTGANLAEAKRSVRSLAANSPPQEWPELNTLLPTLPGTFPDAQELVQALPDVSAAQLRVQAASARVDLRDRERRLDPTLSLRGGTEDDATLIGINVTIPLAIRNRLNNEVVAAYAQQRQAEQVSADVARGAYARIISARERFQLSYEAWKDWQATGGVSLRRQSDLLRRLWDAGELSTTEFLVQIEQTLDTQESALELRQAVWRAWFEWLVASGQVDRWIDLGDLQ